MSMNNQTVVLEGKKCNLLPFSFLDEVGSKIHQHFGDGHTVTQQMYSAQREYAKRGVFLIKQGTIEEPAFALTIEEVDFLRKNYNRSQEIF